MWNLLRKALFVLGVLALAVVVTILLVSPQIVVDFATRLATAEPVLRAAQVLIAVLLDAILIAVIYRTLFPGRIEGLTVRARGARTAVSLDSVQRQINTAVAQITDVLAVQTDVVADQGNVRLALRVRTRPDIIVPEKQKEINRILRQVVEKQLGLRLAGPAVIHIALSADEYEPTEQRATLITDEYLPPEPPRYAALAPRATSAETPMPAGEPIPQPASRIAPPAEWAGEEEEEASSEDEAPAERTAEPAEEPAADEPWRAFLMNDDTPDRQR